MMRHLLLLLLLLAHPLSRADESRFDPPLKGAYLGVGLEETPAGLRISRVEEESAAAAAGLLPGDILLRFGELDGLRRWNIRKLGQTLSELSGGGAYEISVLRKKQEVRLRIKPDPALARDARELARRFQSHRLFNALENKQALLKKIEGELVQAVRRSISTQAAYEALNEIIDRFGVSHTAIIPPWSYASMLGKGEDGKPAFHLGLTVQKLATRTGERFFVRELMYGGAAREAGLRIGDELLAVNGIAFSNSPRKTLAGYEARHSMYTIQVDGGERVRLGCRRKAGEAARDLEATADRASTALDSTRRSVRMLGPTAPGVGYIHLWNLLSPETVSIFEGALARKLRSARALVLDLRGRGGQVQVLKAIAKRVEADGRPTAVLVDDLARSAKEVLAYMLKGGANITLVGDTTAGAVRAAGYVTFGSQLRVMLPVNARIQIERLTDGIDLEGRGVKPDIFVEFQLPYLAGRDPILERAITLLRNEAPRPLRRRL